MSLLLKRRLKFSRYAKHWRAISIHIENLSEQKNECPQNASTPYHYWEEPVGFNTGIQVYNTVCRQKVPLILRRPNFLTWYTCGPTVYDEAHIGHAFCYMKFDIIRRILQDFYNIDVLYQMGITDIDDKIIKRSNEEKINFQVIAKKYEAEFMDDLAQLNILPPVIVTRVTDHIPVIINFIGKLIEQKFAYVTNSGNVCFDTLGYGRYGRFIPLISDMNIDFNVESEDNLNKIEKKNRVDFTLWKPVKPNEPWWESPWGKGRPGWHIECSAMASSVLGNKLDIHSGGTDLMYPHHEDEIAQSESYHCCNQWTNYWFHSGHICFNSEKMSKSLKNIIPIKKFLKKYTADEFRMFCLMCSLRHNVNYSEETMNDARIMCEKLSTFQSLMYSYIQGSCFSGSVNESYVLSSLKETQDRVDAALRNDFNTNEVLTSIMNIASVVNKELTNKKDSEQSVRSPAVIGTVALYVNKTIEKLGLELTSPFMKSSVTNMHQQESINAIINNTVKFRQDIRQIALSNIKSTKDHTPVCKALLNVCDEMRENMKALGIKIQDHIKTTGVTWSFEKNMQREQE